MNCYEGIGDWKEVKLLVAAKCKKLGTSSFHFIRLVGVDMHWQETSDIFVAKVKLRRFPKQFFL